jgi:hypothetical protein
MVKRMNYEYTEIGEKVPKSCRGRIVTPSDYSLRGKLLIISNTTCKKETSRFRPVLSVQTVRDVFI